MFDELHDMRNYSNQKGGKGSKTGNFSSNMLLN